MTMPGISRQANKDTTLATQLVSACVHNSAVYPAQIQTANVANHAGVSLQTAAQSSLVPISGVCVVS